MSYLVPPQFWNPYQAWPAAPSEPNYEQHRIYLNVWFNGKGPVRMLFDTGSDVNMLTQADARRVGLTALKPIRYMNIAGVGGGLRSPVVSTSLKIEGAAPVNAEVVLSNTQFNLISRRTVTQVFNIMITQTGVSFNPKAGGKSLVRRGVAAVEGEPAAAQPPGMGLPDLANIPPIVLVAGGLVVFAMVLK